MGWLSLLLLACALSMDAFAVAIVAGLALKPMSWRHVTRLSLSFGLFQGVMPILGWLAGTAVHKQISAIDHWIAFGLLAVVGGKMLWESFQTHEDEKPVKKDPTAGWSLLVLSVATSIDALAVGLSLAMVESPILLPSAVIAIVCAAFTALGMLLGRRIGKWWGQHVETLGGLILIGIGIKILLDHLSA
jgi:putative Mn2+ efflux pump MntP